MIPDKIIRFLQLQGNAAVAGTRDRNLMPYGHRVSGWQLQPDSRTLTAFIGNPFVEGFLQTALDNGQIAITIEEFPSLETYQVKGRYVSHRPVRPEEIELVNRTRERYVKNITTLNPDYQAHADLVRASIPDAAIAVDVDVQEVFVQTPGPTAGARVYPPAEN